MSIFFYLRVQGTNNGRLPLFGKHISHEKVAITGDCAVQTILLTGKVYLKKKIMFVFFYIFLLTISIVISMPKILHDAISAECTNWHRHHLQSKAGLLPGFQLPCGAGPDSCAASVGLHDHILDSLTPPTPLGTGALPPQLDYPNLEIQVQIQIQCDGKSTINLLCVNCFSLL